MVAIWRNAMVCARCHGAFFPSGASPAGPAGLLIPVDGFQAAVIELGARLTVEGPARPGLLPPAR